MSRRRSSRSRAYLPSNLPANPTYRKVNPADAPIMILGLTSDKYGPDKLYDEASTVIEQKLSQITGSGRSPPAAALCRRCASMQIPTQLAAYGLTLANLAAVFEPAECGPGQRTDHRGRRTVDILANDQISHAADYKDLVVGFNKGAAVRLADVAEVIDSVQNVRAAGYLNGKRAVMLIIFRQPGANIIETVDRIRRSCPPSKHRSPSASTLTIVLDRTTTIRASLTTSNKR